MKITMRNESGHFVSRDVWPGKFAKEALNTIIHDGVSHRGTAQDDGWWFLHQWLCSALIDQAEKVAMSDPSKADEWYARYQAVRGIK